MKEQINQIKYDVFISYSRSDYENANKQIISGNPVSKIKDAFHKNNITYWFDEEGVYSGTKFMHIITEAIEQSAIFLFVSSKNSNTSLWTAGEVLVALEGEKRIIPFRVDESSYNKSFKIALTTLDFIDYQSNQVLGLQRLVDSVLQYKVERENEKREFERIAEQQKEKERQEKEWKEKKKSISNQLVDFEMSVRMNFKKYEELIKSIDVFKDEAFVNQIRQRLLSSIKLFDFDSKEKDDLKKALMEREKQIVALQKHNVEYLNLLKKKKDEIDFLNQEKLYLKSENAKNEERLRAMNAIERESKELRDEYKRLLIHRSACRKRYITLIWLMVFFVVTSIVLGVLLYVNYKKLSESQSLSIPMIDEQKNQPNFTLLDYKVKSVQISDNTKESNVESLSETGATVDTKKNENVTNVIKKVITLPYMQSDTSIKYIPGLDGLELLSKTKNKWLDVRVESIDIEQFNKLVETSNIEDKELILRVVSMYSDTVEKNERIRKMSVAYRTLGEEVLPKCYSIKIGVSANTSDKTRSSILKFRTSDRKKTLELTVRQEGMKNF